MADDIQERRKLRWLALWLVLLGVAIGAVIYFAGGAVGTFIGNLGAGQDQVSSIELSTFHDANSDGRLDPTDPAEHPVNELSVSLAGPLNQQAHTNSVGQVTFSSLTAGEYSVTAKIGDTELEIAPTSISVSGGEDVSASLAVSSTSETLSAVSGYVFSDSNDNGIIEGTDPDVDGASITLADESGATIIETTTNAEGLYLIPDLREGEYTIGLSHSEGSDSQGFSIKSSIDRVTIDWLLPSPERTSHRQTTNILAQAPSLGLDILKLASDNDELDREFVHTKAGQSITFEVTVQTAGTSSDSYPSTKIVDDYPSFLGISGISGGGIDDGSKITWNLGTLLGGVTKSFSYTGTVASGTQDGQQDNVATVSSNAVSSKSDDTTIIVSSQPSNILASSNQTGGSTQATLSGDPSSSSQTTFPFGANGIFLAAITSGAILIVGSVLVIGIRRANYKA